LDFHHEGTRLRRLDLDVRLGRAAPDRLFLLALGYLLFPALIFVAGWLWWPWALAGSGAALAGFGLAPGRRGWPLGRRGTLACLGGGLAWAVLCTGTHHLLYAAVDWQIRDAVLHDLADGGWPVAYAVGDLTWLLRAPVAYYLPAALAGPHAALPLLYLWTALGLALTLALIAALAREAGATHRDAVWVCLVFTAFGGLDLLPNLWLDGGEGPGLAAYWGRGGEWWARFAQYSGHATLLLWAPNHALPGWLPALLLARHARHPAFQGAAGLVLVAGGAWAPVSAAGAALLLVAALLAQGPPAWRATLCGAPNWLALLLAVPVGLFLAAGSAGIPHGWLLAADGPASPLRLLVFLLVELGAVALLLLALLRWRPLLSAVALLCALPLYLFGPGNEMTMRGGIAAFALLALAAGLGWRLAPPGWRRATLALVLILGAAGQAMEASILANPPWKASPGCSLPEAAAQSVFEESTDWSHYVLPWPDPRLAPLLAPVQPRLVDPANLARCWPEAPRDD